MTKQRSKVRFDRRIFAERPRNQLPPPEENSFEQLRALSQWLLLAPVLMFLIFGSGQLALLSNPKIAFADTPSDLRAEYGQWGFLQVHSVKKEIITEIRRDFKGIKEVGEAFSEPVEALHLAWIEEPSSPLIVAALPTILPVEPTIVPPPMEGQQNSFLQEVASTSAISNNSNSLESTPPAIFPTPTILNSPTEPPEPTETPPSVFSPTPTTTASLPTDSPNPTNTPPGTPTTSPTTPPTSVPTLTSTSTPLPPTATSPPTSTPIPTATATQGGGDQDSWWASCYDYRKKVTVVTAGSGVNEGYSARVIFNHSSLVSSGKSRSNGNDVRVVWQSGANAYELDRVVSHDSSWNRSNTQILFKLAAGIPEYSSDGNYYLYYGCSSPGSPLEDPNDVYWYSNRFNTDNALSGWTQRDVENVGDWRVINGHLELESSGRQTDRLPNINHKLVLTGKPVIQGLLVNFEFLMRDNDLITVGLCSNDNSPSGFYVGYSSDRWFNDDDVSDRTGYWASASDTGHSGINLSEDTIYYVKLAWTSSRILNSINGREFQWNSGPSTANYFCFAANSMDAALDDLFIREYVDPEPTSQLGGEETH